MTRAWLAALVALASASCEKEGATQPPTVAATPTDTGAEDVPDPASGAVDDAATDPEGSGPAANPGADSDADPAADSAADQATDSAGDSTPDPAPGPTALALPKPLYGSVKRSCGNDPGVGQKLKDFKLPTTEGGKTYSNASFRGRVLLVNFWGTWCKPCLEELPKFAQLYRRYREHGMTLLAIATDEDVDAVKDTLSAKKIAAKVAVAGEAYAGNYKSPNFPFTFVVDHKGVIAASYFGYEPECMGKLEADIRAQLEKRADARQ